MARTAWMELPARQAEEEAAAAPRRRAAECSPEATAAQGAQAGTRAKGVRAARVAAPRSRSPSSMEARRSMIASSAPVAAETAAQADVAEPARSDKSARVVAMDRARVPLVPATVAMAARVGPAPRVVEAAVGPADRVSRWSLDEA